MDVMHMIPIKSAKNAKMTPIFFFRDMPLNWASPPWYDRTMFAEYLSLNSLVNNCDPMLLQIEGAEEGKRSNPANGNCGPGDTMTSQGGIIRVSVGGVPSGDVELDALRWLSLTVLAENQCILRLGELPTPSVFRDRELGELSW